MFSQRWPRHKNCNGQSRAHPFQTHNTIPQRTRSGKVCFFHSLSFCSRKVALKKKKRPWMEFFKIEGWKLSSSQSESQIVLEFPVVNWRNVTVGSVNVRPLMAFQEKRRQLSITNQWFSSRISWFSSAHTWWTIYAWVGSIVLFVLAQPFHVERTTAAFWHLLLCPWSTLMDLSDSAPNNTVLLCDGPEPCCCSLMGGDSAASLWNANRWWTGGQTEADIGKVMGTETKCFQIWFRKTT